MSKTCGTGSAHSADAYGQSYSPSQILTVLRDGTDNVEEAIDINQAASRLPEPMRSVLTSYAQGYSISQSMYMWDVTGNPSRYLALIQTTMAALLNGGEGDVPHSTE